MFCLRAGFLATLGLGLATQVMGVSFTTLDFNNLQIGEQVLDYYDGGFGSLGSGPGPDVGVTFSSDFVIVGQGVNFGMGPLQGAELATTPGTMNLDSPFTGLFSFYYTEDTPGAGVIFYSGPNDTGTQVGYIPLPSDSGFSPAGGFVNGFESADFFSSPGDLVIDNVTFGGLVVPEPSTLGFLVLGLAGLGFWRRFRTT